MMDPVQSFITLGIALGLGLLVGMQKERSQSRIAGVRTFALITLLGTVSGLLIAPLGPWVVVAGFLALAASMAVANHVKMREGVIDPGMTTEVAALIMFAVGAYLVVGHRSIAVALGGLVAVLLYAKPVLHGFVRRLGDDDMKGMMQLVLITLVILPVLPDQPFGPFQVINPRQIWWMVVLVVGISFGGTIALKLFGERAGVLLTGLIGGVISSTATTVSHARAAAARRAGAPAAAFVIMAASTIVYARVLVEVAIVARPQLVTIGTPVAVLLGLGIVQCAFMWFLRRSDPGIQPNRENPTELKSAVIFGIIYALVLFAVAAARHLFDDRGIYVVAGLSGLADMDAITLSTARLANLGELTPVLAWRAILIGTIANLAFKAALIGMLGSHRLLARIALPFAIQVGAAVALLVLWPA